jgi:Tol biopolymer transport system component/DNA-binding winged helix-turn-helix (wHTH) protein
MLGNRFSVFRFDDVEVREREFSLVKAGAVLPVEPKAFRVLLMLLRNPQKLISKEELLNAVWGDAAVTENSLTRSIALLRRVLGDDTHNPRYIETVATVGYRWVCRVEVSEDASGVEELRAAPVVALSEGTTIGSRKRMWTRVLAGGGVLALCLAGVLWYLHRPLSPPSVTEYVQITHDGRPKILAGMDGSRLYFTLMSQTPLSPHSLEEVAATGGEIAQIPVAVPGGIFLAVDVSPDGSSALIASVEKGNPPFAFWSASMVGGSLHRLLGSAQGAAYSPDGRSVAYTTAEGDLWIMGSNGSGAHKVGSVGSGGAYMPTWSPDGSVIRFAREGHLWEIASSGSNLHRLLPGWHDADGECCGHWTPDGKFFVFVSGQLWGNRGQIWALDERRGLLRWPPKEPIQLTSGPTRWGMPVPSKDGKKIFAEGTSRHGELSRYDAKSGQLQPFLKGISADGVAFSKDGESVAYVSYPEAILWKANRDGSNPVQLSWPPMYPMNPRWSFDGTQILFMDVAPGVVESYIVPSEGGSPRRILQKESGNQSEPNWSPDGKKIVFDTGVPDNPGEGGMRMLDVASGQVTSVPGSARMWSPRWSPDGRKIAALKTVTSTAITSGLTVFDVEAQRWTTLVTKDGIEFPTFSADSQFLYYLLLGSDQAVYKVRVNGGEPERVMDLKDQQITGNFSFWMALDPTDAPLLLRDNGTSDLYALTLEDK